MGGGESRHRRGSIRAPRPALPVRLPRAGACLLAGLALWIAPGCSGADDGGPASARSSPATASDATVTGEATAPVATPAMKMPWRPPTAKERAGIVALLSREFAESRSCFAGDVYRIATIDRRYALWSSFRAGSDHRAANGCLLGDGFIILRRRRDGPWTRLVDWSWTSAPCSVIGARVATDLTGLPCA